MKVLFDQGVPVVLMSASWPRIQLHIGAIESAIATASAGRFVEVSM